MTGAGSAEVAYRVESNYLSAGAGSWIQPGVDVQVTDLTIDNQPNRNRQPDNNTPERSRVGNFSGTIGVTWALTDTNWHDLVPTSGGSLSGVGPAAPSAEWYFSTGALDSANAQFSQDLTAAGAALQNAEVQHQENEDVTVSATIPFGGVSGNTPTSITQPSASDVFTHHGASLSIGGTAQSGLTSATLSLANLSRFRQEASRTPLDAVVGATSPELSTDANFTEADQLEAAIGGNSVTSIADQIDGHASGSLDFTNGAGTTISYSLTRLQPANYQWTDLINADGDLSEPVTYHVADVGGF